MMGPEAAERRGDRATAPTAGGYRSAAPQLRAARIGIGIGMVAAVLDAILSLVAAAVTGWAIGFDPGNSAALLGSLRVSAGVADLLGKVTGIAAAAWVLLVLALLASGVCVIRWQTTALGNSAVLADTPVNRWSPWAAAAAWVVPVWSLFAPLRLVNNLRRSSEPTQPGESARSELKPPTVPTRHALWWALWLGALLLSVLGALRMRTTPTLATLLTGQLNQAVVDAALVGAGLLLIGIATEITTRQDAHPAGIASRVRREPAEPPEPSHSPTLPWRGSAHTDRRH